MLPRSWPRRRAAAPGPRRSPRRAGRAAGDAERGVVLGLGPAGAEADLGPPARQVVDGGGRLGQHPGVAVAGRCRPGSRSAPGSSARQRSVDRHRLVALVAAEVRRVEVVPHGDGVEAEVLGTAPQLGQLRHRRVLAPMCTPNVVTVPPRSRGRLTGRSRPGRWPDADRARQRDRDLLRGDRRPRRPAAALIMGLASQHVHWPPSWSRASRTGASGSSSTTTATSGCRPTSTPRSTS